MGLLAEGGMAGQGAAALTAESGPEVANQTVSGSSARYAPIRPAISTMTLR
jgi:hypothetical protein